MNIEICNEDFYNSYKNIGDYFIVSNPPWGEKHNIEPKHENLFFEKLIAIISQSKGAVILIPEDLINNLKSRGISHSEILQTRVRGKLASVIIIK